MKKAVRKGASKAVALVLSLAMIFGMVPMVSASANNTADAQDNFDRIVHLDMGRKYYSPEWIKALIQEISALGYTELELDFSNNEGFRFSLPAEQMQIEVGGYETVLVEMEPEEGAQDAEEPVTAVPLADEEAAVPVPTSTAQPEEGESEPTVTDEPESTPQYKEVEVFQSKIVDLSTALSADYITAEEMEDIIACADKAGIEIVPLLNSPGHMGAILSVYPQYQWTDDLGRTSESTIDLENDEAVRFAVGMVTAYVQWFRAHGCTAFNIGADEFANDIGGVAGTVMGLDYIYNYEKDVYSKLIAYINDLANIVKVHDMTPRAFNDSFCYNNDTAYAPIKDIQVCYWSSGWGGYNVASASTLETQGYQLINTHGDYYYVLGKPDCWDNGSARYDFDNNVFPGSTISDPVGSMFCIWSDYPNAETEQKVAEKVRVPLRIMAARMKGETVSAGTVDTSVIPGGFNADGTINTDVPSTTVEDATSGIKVTAPGLTGIKVSETTVEALQGDYVAYDMTPVAGDKNYTDKAEVSIPLGKMANYEAGKLIGFVVEPNGNITEIPGEVSGNSYVFTMPHFSVGGVMLRSDSATETREITVTVGQTETDTITGENYAGNSYNTENPDIATVTVEGQDGSEASEKYSKAEGVKCSQLIGEDSSNWMSTSYYYTPDNGENYYSLYAKRSSGFMGASKNYTWGYSKTGNANDVDKIGTQSTDWWGDPDVNITLYRKSTTPGTEASTTVTFQGESVGDTTVTVGHVKYNIHVIAENLDNVKPLPVEFWITNRQVTADGMTQMEISAKAPDVYSESGAIISSLIPQKGASSGNEMDYWKATRLDYNHKQTDKAGVDQTKAGTDFNYIRYWNGEWSYSVDGRDWINVASGDQIVAYYLQRTDVTDEVVTQVVDWGPKKENWGDLKYLGNQYVVLDYTVKYENGQERPSQFPTENSLGFHCEKLQYRTLGMIRGLETADYEVYMITLTPTADGEREHLSGQTIAENRSYSYNGTEVIAWAASQDIIDNSELGTYESISGAFKCEVGGEPIVSGLEIYRQHGMKVTYYVRAKVTEDSLGVHYIDETNGSETEFYSYNIAVISGTLFDPGFALQNGSLVNNTVINKQGEPQSVGTDLGKLSEIGPQYKYSDYTCTHAERSADGKDVYLYYTFNNTHTFVADFGLPVTIEAEDLGIQGTPADVKVTGAKYGSTEVKGTSVTYTPNRMINEVEILTYTMTDSKGEKATQTIYLVPASTVYYEDSFASYNGNWTTVGSAEAGRVQTTSKLGDKKIYGYDAAYASDTGYSGGSAHQVTLTSGQTATASFTFHGTGFQLVSMTDATSGCITVHVEGNGVDNYYFVDCYYQNGGALNQVPVMKVDGLDLGTYTVTVTAGHLSSFDWNKDGKSTFVLDGIRIYEPVGDYENYKQDNEGSTVYSEIRNILIDGYWDPSNSVYVDTLDRSTSNLEEYRKVGPNNEVYLKNGDKITFTVPTGGSIVQIGAKLVSGNEMTFTVGQQQYKITSAAEMYYLLNGVNPGDKITITATGDDILSLTNLKLVSGS